MNKKIAILICVLTIITMIFSACATKEKEDTSSPGAVVDPEDTSIDEDATVEDTTIIVAELDGEPIYKNEYNELYSYYCSTYGVEEDNEEYASMIQEMVFADLIGEKVLYKNLEEKGYMELTDEQQAQAEQSAQAELDYYIEYYYMTTIEEELGEDYSDEDLQAKMEEYETILLESAGRKKEDVIKNYKYDVASEAAFEELTGDVKPTDEEVLAQYDENVAASQEEMDEDPTAYVSNVSNGYTLYYVPEGVRSVKQILISLDDDTTGAISVLRESDYDDAADILLAEGLAGVQEEAEEVLDLLQSGEITFDEAIAAYNDDTGMDADSEGYPVVEGCTAYVDSFTQGAMSLVNIGEISELIISDYGYHIIEYSLDIAQGSVDYENVKQEIYDELLAGLQNEAWTALLDEWEEASEIVYYYDKV